MLQKTLDQLGPGTEVLKPLQVTYFPLSLSLPSPPQGGHHLCVILIQEDTPVDMNGSSVGDICYANKGCVSSVWDITLTDGPLSWTETDYCVCVCVDIFYYVYISCPAGRKWRGSSGKADVKDNI